jgi:hypothetical protein
MNENDRPTPSTEDFQPDPQLKLSSGRANWLQTTLVAAACAFILGLMIYGLNQPLREGNVVASSPGGAETTGAAPQSEQAQTGGNIAGGQNADQPAAATQQQSEPSQQPTPEQTKPATPDDSKR